MHSLWRGYEAENATPPNTGMRSRKNTLSCPLPQDDAGPQDPNLRARILITEIQRRIGFGIAPSTYIRRQAYILDPKGITPFFELKLQCLSARRYICALDCILYSVCRRHIFILFLFFLLFSLEMHRSRIQAFVVLPSVFLLRVLAAPTSSAQPSANTSPQGGNASTQAVNLWFSENCPTAQHKDITQAWEDAVKIAQNVGTIDFNDVAAVDYFGPPAFNSRFYFPVSH